jgi:hypothetical protein
MAENSKHSNPPWYESNLLWGPLALAGGIILTVVAAMKHDVRWLLWCAWPCFSVAIWWLARRTREVWLVSILGIIVAGGLLLWLSNWLRGSQQVASTHTLPVPSSEKLAPTPDTTQPQIPAIKPVEIPAKPTPAASARRKPPSIPTQIPVDPSQGTGGGTVGGGITAGPCSNIQVGGNGNQAQTNCGPIDRHLSVDQRGAIKNAIAAFPDGVKLQVYTPQGSEPFQFGKEISDVAHELNKGEDLIISLEPFPKGVYILVNSQTDISFPSAQEFGNVLVRHGIAVTSFEAHSYVKSGTIRWVVSEQPNSRP